MITRDIINILEKKFPKINAEEWDNVGLLVGDYDKEVKNTIFYRCKFGSYRKCYKRKG